MPKYNVDITELLQKGMGEEIEFSIPLETDAHKQIKFLPESNLYGDISHIGEHLLINFSTDEGELTQACARCLTEIKQITTIGPALESYSLTNAEENDFVLQSQDPETHQQFLDLSPLLTQELELLADQSILCSEDCKGLCQYCGKNLNKKQCNCKDIEKDKPAEQPLRHLFQPQK